VYGSRRTV